MHAAAICEAENLSLLAGTAILASSYIKKNPQVDTYPGCFLLTSLRRRLAQKEGAGSVLSA